MAAPMMPGPANFGQAAPPWALWGNTQTVIVQPTPVVSNVPNNTTTMVRVAYGRPENWRFLFALQLLSGGTATDVGETGFVEVSFELVTGLGRSAIKLVDFCLLQVDWSNGFTPRLNQMVYATSVPAFNSLPFPPADPVPRIDTFPGQDITIVAKASYITDTTVLPLLPVTIEMSAHVAPSTHIRPDWLQIDAPPTQQFPGGETGAR